jgi:hypothetical protein
MKKLNLKSKWLMMILATFMVVNITNFYAAIQVQAQVDLDYSSLEDETKDVSDTIINVVQYLIGGVLAIGLIVVVYKVSTSDPRSREWVVGWFLATLIYVVAMKLIN